MRVRIKNLSIQTSVISSRPRPWPSSRRSHFYVHALGGLSKHVRGFYPNAHHETFLNTKGSSILAKYGSPGCVSRESLLWRNRHDRGSLSNRTKRGPMRSFWGVVRREISQGTLKIVLYSDIPSCALAW